MGRTCSGVIVVGGGAALLALTDFQTAGLYGLGAIPAIACIWFPEWLNGSSDYLAVFEFDRSGTGLIGEPAYIVGWLLLLAWGVGVLLELQSAF